jgi:LysM repeat protein
VVKQGDSLYSIQQQYKIISADELLAAIQYCKPNAAGSDLAQFLQIGSEICLPGSEKPGCVNVRAFNNQPDCKVYVTQQGDTVESVANNLDIFRDMLASINADVTGATGILKPGQFLKLPPWSQQCGDPNQATERCRVYKVVTGDFIAGIASAYGVSVDDLLAVNKALNANSVLQNGQPINIPPFDASCGAGKPSKPPTNTVLNCRAYRVQQGDDINSIAIAFKLSTADILAVNPEIAGGALVQPGTVLKIPPHDNTCEKTILVDLPTDGNDGGSSTSGGQSPVPVAVPVTPVTSLPPPVPVVISPPPVPVTVDVPPPVPTSAPDIAPVPVSVPTSEEVVVTVAPAPAPMSGSKRAFSGIVAAGAAALSFFLA